MKCAPFGERSMSARHPNHSLTHEEVEANVDQKQEEENAEHNLDRTHAARTPLIVCHHMPDGWKSSTGTTISIPTGIFMVLANSSVIPAAISYAFRRNSSR